MTSMLLAALFAAYICYVNGQSSCTTPSGDAGTCKPSHQCDVLLDAGQKQEETFEYTNIPRSSQCDLKKDASLVCCPKPCYTPEGQPGKCTIIHTCPHLVKMLGPEASQEDKQYLRNSRCLDSDNYFVCCGPPPNKNPITTGNCAATVSAFPPDPRTGCCGKDSRVDNEVVGFGATKIRQYPWAVMIEYESDDELTPICLGTLISGKYVLTAAHCVHERLLKYATPKYIRLGEYDTTTGGPDCVTSETGDKECTEGDVLIPIETVIAHPDYISEGSQIRNDIGLIRMQRMAPFTDFIRPICLPQVDLTLTPPVNFTMFVASWRHPENNPSKKKLKYQVDLPFVNLETCQRDSYSKNPPMELWNKQFCAGGVIGKDTCMSDGGSSLVYETERTFEAIGITSFGSFPCAQGYPGVYTKVYDYTAWIRRTIEP